MGPFAADVFSFQLHLAAENKAAGTIRIYTEAPLWFAAAYLLHETDKTRWEQVGTQDVQRWVAWLLGSYSATYARQQYRSLQQFFKWLAAEDEVPDPMAGLRPPHVPDKPVPVFADGDLRRLERACAGRSFQQRRDAAIFAANRLTRKRRQLLQWIGRIGDRRLVEVPATPPQATSASAAPGVMPCFPGNLGWADGPIVTLAAGDSDHGRRPSRLRLVDCAGTDARGAA